MPSGLDGEGACSNSPSSEKMGGSASNRGNKEKQSSSFLALAFLQVGIFCEEVLPFFVPAMADGRL